MKRLLLISSALSLLQAGSSFAQTQSAIVVTTCGTPPLTYTAGQPYPVTQNTSGQVCGASSSTPSGTQNVNITEVNGATANLAQETGGNLATVATAQGASGTGITQPTGGSGLLGWLSGIYRAVIGTGTASVNIQGSSAAGATDDSSNPIKIGCVFNSTLPTYTTGQRANVQCDSSGNERTLIVGLPNPGADAVSNGNIVEVQQSTSQTGGVKPLAIAPWLFNGTSWDRQQSALGQIAGGGLGIGAAVEEAGESFVHITTATTTVVKSGAGILHKVCENTIAASASITAYNNTTATAPVIGVVTNPLTLLQMGPLCATYDLYFSTGLTIVTTGAQDLTVTYR